MIGKRFGALTVTAQATPDKWKARCICGIDAEVSTKSLLSGRKQSCGWKTPHGLRARGCVGRRVMEKVRAYQKREHWQLDETLAINIFLSPCYYCGKGGFPHPGTIDRWDSAKGYAVDNVLPSCWPCNRAKNAMEAGEFIRLVEDIYKHMATTKDPHDLTRFKITATKNYFLPEEQKRENPPPRSQDLRMPNIAAGWINHPAAPAGFIMIPETWAPYLNQAIRLFAEDWKKARS